MKKYLKLYAYNQREHFKVSPHAFCITSQRVTLCSKVKALSAEAVGKPSLNRANKLHGVDPKPGDLSMGRLKQW